MTKEPKKFVGLHSHSNFSTGDGLNFPQEHIDFAISNGMDALALTDHGNMNGFAHQYYHWEKLKKKGVSFKAIPGNEMYFIDSLSEWAALKESMKKEKTASADKKTKESSIEDIGDETAKDAKELEENYKASDDDENSSVLENESETKGYQKYSNPINQRNHLVVLPKNQQGLYALFKITSMSYKDGFFRYPRVDFDLLEKYSKGNLIATSACIGGRMSKIVFDNQLKPYEEWGKETLHDNEELIQLKIKEYAERFAHVLGGKENFYLEIQMNKLPQQHLVNYHLIQAHKKFGIPIVATCDAHYSDPSYWRERELHKLMAWSTKMKGAIDVNSIPKTADELKAELYPKNAEQMWKTYNSLKSEYDFYEKEGFDDIVCNAIEQSHVIAHEQIEKDVIVPDRKIKLPAIEKLISKDSLDKYLGDDKFKDANGETDEDRIAFAELKKKSIQGLIWRKKHTEQKYIDQLKLELDTMKHLKVSKYLLTYEKLMKELQNHMITGPGRGCLSGEEYVLTKTNGFKKLKEINIGDKIVDSNGLYQDVINHFEYDIDEKCLVIKTEHSFGDVILTEDHKVYCEQAEKIKYKNNLSESTLKSIKVWKDLKNTPVWVEAKNLKIGDYIYTPFIKNREVKDVNYIDLGQYTDALRVFDDQIEIKTSSNNNDFNIRTLSKKIGVNRTCFKQYIIGKVNENNKRFSVNKSKIDSFFKENNISKEQVYNHYMSFSDLKKINRYIPFDEQFSYFLGRWIGDGWIIDDYKHRKYAVGIAFNAEDVKSINYFENYFKTLGFDVKNLKSKTTKLVQMFVYSKSFVLMMRSLFPKYHNTSNSKYIGDFINLPDNKLLSLINGIIDSDGHIKKGKYDNRTNIDSTSLILILELKQALLYLKCPSAIQTRKEYFHPQNKKWLCKESYKISFNFKNKNKNIFEDGYYSKITGIAETSEIKKVYDISVNNNPSYLTTNGIMHNSGAGSLVCYVLSITQIDPLQYGLLFSRFMSKVKHGLPDVDSDTSDREVALQLITKLFGEENVLAISNYNQLQLRSLIKDLGRVYGIPFEDLNKYTTVIESEALEEAKKESGFDKATWILDYDEAFKSSQTFRDLMEKYPELDKSIKILFKQIKNTSRHSGGVAITNKAYDIMPVIKSGKVFQTPWVEGLNNRHLEGLGILKFDILGLGTLRMIEKCVEKIIKKETGKKYITFQEINEWYYNNLHPDNNSMDDLKVYQNIYWNGKWAGIFQFVNESAQKFIQKLKPTSIADIAAATSIFRPGALAMSADKLYMKNKEHPDKVKYKHPLLKDVLSETYGCIIFQEHLQLIYHKMAGVPLEETDLIRKAFTKKDLSNKEKAAEERKKLKEEFVIKCKENNNIDESITSELFDELEKMVSYSFNKAHAVSYATVSYMCAYLLTYYPDEWITSYIDYAINDKGKAAGKEDPKDVALAEAVSLGYKLGKPDINYSTHEYTCKDKVLIPSITSLKGVGKTVLDEIGDYRPYKSIEDLLWHVENNEETWRHSKLNKRAFSALVRMEAFDSMDIVGEGKTFKNYKQMYYALVEAADELKKAVSRKKNRNHKELLEQKIKEAQELPDWTRAEKLQNKKELAGMSDQDLIVTPQMVEFLKAQNISPVHSWESDQKVYWAIVVSANVATTKTGKKYLKLKLKSENGTEHFCSIWNYKEGELNVKENDVVVGSFSKNNFGLSTFPNKVYKLNQND